MSSFKFNNFHIVGIATTVPAKVERTMSFSADYDIEDYLGITDVLEKRVSKEFTNSDLGQAAAEQPLNRMI